MPELSVVMTSKNDAAMLENMCRQIRAQSYKDYELLIFPCSTRDYIVARMYGDVVFPKFSSSDSRNMYEVPEIYNKSFKVTKGKYVLILDTDLEFTDNHELERIMKYVQKTRYKAYTCNIRQKGNFSLEASVYHMSKRIFPHISQFSILDRDFVIKKFGGNLYVNVWGWDSRTSTRLNARGYNVHMLPETMYHLRKYRNTIPQTFIGFFK